MGQDRGPCARRGWGTPWPLGSSSVASILPNLTWSQILLRARGQLLQELTSLGLQGPIGQAGGTAWPHSEGEVGRSQAPEPPPRDLNPRPLPG